MRVSTDTKRIGNLRLPPQIAQLQVKVEHAEIEAKEAQYKVRESLRKEQDAAERTENGEAGTRLCLSQRVDLAC